MSKHFTHLHLHTEYSLLDGAITIDKLVDFAKKQQFKALAMTDHGNVFGAVKFFQKCKKAGIKPVLGIEMYFAPDVLQKSVEKKYYHLILLVQNKVGYKNLCKLISFAYQQGFYFKPRIDYAILEKHCEGLIATTACLGGHIPSLLMQEHYQEVDQRVAWFLEYFGKDRFYLEIQPEDQQEQKVLNQKLYDLNAKTGINLIAAGDCHYLLPEDHEAHEVMLSIQTQHKLTDPDRFTFGQVRAYVKTQEEMLNLFADHQEAVWQSGDIADRCEFDFDTNTLFFPQFEIPAQFTQDQYFSHICNEGLQKLISDNRIDLTQISSYQERLNLEIDLIIKMGFVGYFLVVSDFIQWAKRNSIPVGPGRGSAAGSLVAWALEITNIDPIKYNLLFERFLNPERITMPDIDIDFCIERREDVINYVRKKYGHANVGQIITFGTMMAKGVVKDVARVLGMPFEDANSLSALIPEQLKITLTEAVEQEPRLKELIEQNPTVKQLFSIAFKLEGITRHASKHAAGIVISPEPIDQVLPVYIPSKSTELVTQYAMTELESIGFLKMDLLGLKNLTLIDRVVHLIKKNHQVSIDIDKIPLDDQKTFELLKAGKTSGVFQLESDGIKDVLYKLQPERFEDIIAVNALYRPGPLGSGMVDDFIERKHGRQKIVYLFPELESVLQETYGVIVYQEQVMKIASTIAGYSLGESDILRRAMGKKKSEVMAEQRELFMKRAIERNFDQKKAGELFDLMAYFAGYGFNKSHSAAYALIAYQTAYLKAHYVAEFMACLISLEATHPDKMVFYLQEAKDLHLSILPPDINTSLIDFSVVHNKLLFGLQGIKNVGLAALETLLKERDKKPFLDLFDFCMRVDLRTVNKRVIESLICAGAFDQLPGNRAQKFQQLTELMDCAVERKKELATGQLGLFRTITTTTEQKPYEFSPLPDWGNKEKLEREREVIGFYLSSHPLQAYQSINRWLRIQPFETILANITHANTLDEPIVTVCGLLSSCKQIITKKNERMAFAQLEDTISKGEVVIFPKLFQKIEPWLNAYHIFIIKGNVDSNSQKLCKIKALEMVPAEHFFQEWSRIEKLCIIPPLTCTKELLQNLQQSLVPGSTVVQILIAEKNKFLQIQTNMQCSVNADILAKIEQLGCKIRLVV